MVLWKSPTNYRSFQGESNLEIFHLLLKKSESLIHNFENSFSKYLMRYVSDNKDQFSKLDKVTMYANEPNHEEYAFKTERTLRAKLIHANSNPN
jgi:hypothetical protein